MSKAIRAAKLTATKLYNDTQIAGILGVSPSYMSQLKKDPVYETALANALASNTEDATEAEALDARYTAVEHSLLNGIEQQAPYADIRQLSAALKVVVERQALKHKQPSANPLGGSPTLVNMVQINLPHQALAPIGVTVNEQGQVIEVAGRSFATLSSEGVVSLFSTTKGEQHEPSSLTAATAPSSTASLPELTGREELV